MRMAKQKWQQDQEKDRVLIDSLEQLKITNTAAIEELQKRIQSLQHDLFHATQELESAGQTFKEREDFIRMSLIEQGQESAEKQVLHEALVKSHALLTSQSNDIKEELVQLRKKSYLCNELRRKASIHKACTIL